MKTMALLWAGLVVAAAGCAADGEQLVIDEVTGGATVGDAEGVETPYYGCWSYTAYSDWTTNDCNYRTAALYSYVGSDLVGRRQSVRERANCDSHAYSVRVVTSAYDAPAAASQWDLYIDCSGSDRLYGWTSTVCALGDCDIGCWYPETVIAAKIRVRTASC
jgi:hypothetical protein